MKTVYLLATTFSLFIVVWACSPKPNKHNPGAAYSQADGYVFERKQYEHDAINLHIVVEPSQAVLSSKVTVQDGSQVMAFSTLGPGPNDCTMHIVDPYVTYSPEWVGHEVMHCIYGQWHDQPVTSQH